MRWPDITLQAFGALKRTPTLALASPPITNRESCLSTRLRPPLLKGLIRTRPIGHCPRQSVHDNFKMISTAARLGIAPVFWRGDRDREEEGSPRSRPNGRAVNSLPRPASDGGSLDHLFSSLEHHFISDDALYYRSDAAGGRQRSIPFRGATNTG